MIFPSLSMPVVSAASRLHFPFILKHVFTLLGFLCCCIPTLPAQHTYRILNDEREALQCRIDLIQKAKSEILLSTFIIKDDVLGGTMLQLLIDAAKRGVTVRVMVDDFGNHLSSDLLVYLAEQGVENRVFNIKKIGKFRTMVDRMHGKMLITDRQQFIVGGRNLKQQYYNLDSISNFLDREVYVRDTAAVNAARAHFYDIWTYPKIIGRKTAKLTD
ncbi:MAG: phospholipase D-like domain-containing protein, partial [Saprospiraceae bacterium]